MFTFHFFPTTTKPCPVFVHQDCFDDTVDTERPVKDFWRSFLSTGNTIKNLFDLLPSQMRDISYFTRSLISNPIISNSLFISSAKRTAPVTLKFAFFSSTKKQSARLTSDY